MRNALEKLTRREFTYALVDANDFTQRSGLGCGFGLCWRRARSLGQGRDWAGEVVFPPSEFFQLGNHEGKVVDLRDFKGRIVLLNFWATWCGPCRYEIPDLVKMRSEHETDQVAIIGISL